MTETTPADDGMIRAPWTPEQVTALNAFQQRGGMHPFTCGGDHTPGSPALVAYTDGWRCPQPYGEACDYRQDWAHPFMLRAAATVPASAPTDQAALVTAAAGALTAAAHECDGKCGLSERDCYDAHPISFSAMSNGTMHVTGSVTALATVVLAVLPAPAGRAATLREAADAIVAQQEREETTEHAQHGDLDHETEIGRGYVYAAAALLRRLADAASGPGRADGETQQDETQGVVCQGFVWIGQSFATCDRCAQPAWEHEGADVPVDDKAGPFDNRRTIRPWEPGEADRIRAKWTPAAVSQPGKEAETAHACTEFDVWFDRNVCPDPCGAMHQRCDQCGAPIGGCANDTPAQEV